MNESHPVTIRILLLEEDQDDKKIREFVQEEYAIRQQLKGCYVKLCTFAKTMLFDIKVAFLAFDNERNSHTLQAETLDFNNLTGAKVWDYVNPVTHPNETDPLYDFILERHIPAKPSPCVHHAFYVGT